MIAFGKKYIVGITHIFCTNAFPTQKRKPTFLTHLAVFFLASLAKCTLGKDANLHTRWRCIKAKIKKVQKCKLGTFGKNERLRFFQSLSYDTPASTVLVYFNAPRSSEVFIHVTVWHSVTLSHPTSESTCGWWRTFHCSWFHFVWQKNLQRIFLKAARNSLEMNSCDFQIYRYISNAWVFPFQGPSAT